MGDDTLILGQRLAEWLGHGPQLEEDIASANIALDLIGQARLWLSLAGRLEGRGRDEDALAYLRAQHEFRNCTLVELPNGDYAFTIVRRMLFDAYQRVRLERLAGGKDGEIAAIAAKSRKEADYHWRHSADWTLRLGDGTDESAARMRAALELLWPYVPELFEADEIDAHAAATGLGPSRADLRAPWDAEVLPVLEEARLAAPAARKFRSTGMRGVHSEHMGFILAEMQHLQRSHPGAVW
jgi:ring-1,2-phenylacetyl-CoA epoxidase subunit PaaC